MSVRSFFMLWLFLSSLSILSMVHAATITVNVLDGAGVGFNDSTAAAPVGGNDGTTVGEQRLKAFQHVASNIGTYLDSSVTIVIDASFAALSCSANSGVLGSAGSKGIFRDFANAPESNTFYPSALANALAGSDLDASNNDISASFNGDLGKTGCLENSSWYYGFDNNEPSDGIDFIATLTHELIHGLGFSSFASVTTGAFPSSGNPTFSGIFDKFIVDTEQRKLWDSMTNVERVAASINDPDLIWKGDNVTAAFLYLTAGTREVDITTVNGSPTTLKGTFVRLYAPNPVEQGSSVSHFTTAASPNLLMEPAISSDLSSSKIDLSQQLLKDLGWPFQVSSLSDISVTLISSVAEILVGNTFNYLITVSNSANADADLVKTKLVLPTGAVYQSFNGSGWTCAAVTPATTPVEVDCQLSTVIANGSSSAVTIVTTAPSSGSGTISSTVTAATITTEFNATNNTASRSITLSNNNTPVASDATLLTLQNTAASSTLSATDADNDSLTFSIVGNGTKGTAAITNTATGAFTYTPTTGQTGQDSFTFKVNDGTVDSNTATVTVTINTASNAVPVASNSSLTTLEDTVVSNTLSATDADNDSLTFSIVSNGLKGTAAITNTTTGTFTYTPTAGATGADSFTFKTNDGTVDSNTATVSITITAVNKTPVASNATKVTTENSALSSTLTATDADGDSLAFSIVSNGTKGTAVITNPATGAFTYTPTVGESGTDSFTFKANDGMVDSNIATISITINAAPVASNASLSTLEGMAITNTLSASDADSGDTLTFSLVSNGAKGTAVLNNAATGAFTYTPTAGQSGQDSFTFKVNDGTVDSNTATVSISINATPVASNLSVTTTVGTAISSILTATDADSGANLIFSIVSNGTQGTVAITNSATGAFTYTPTGTSAGQDSFTFKVNDGLIDSNTATVSVIINSTQTATSTSGGDIGVSTSGSGANVTELAVLDETAGLITEQAATKPVDTTFPHGFIDYKIEGVAVGATVVIDIVFPSIPTNPKLYKVDTTNGFVEFTAFTISGNTVTITLVDGGAGDADGIANGVIDDPLGLAAAPQVTAGLPLAAAGGGGGGSFDGVFIILLLTLYGLRRYLR